VVQPGKTVLFTFDPAKPDSPIKAFVNGKLVDLDAKTAKMLAQAGLADVRFVTPPTPAATKPPEVKPTAAPVVEPTKPPTPVPTNPTSPPAEATRAPGEVVTLPGELSTTEGGKIICGKQIKIVSYNLNNGTVAFNVVGATIVRTFNAKISDLERMGVLKAGVQPEASCAAPPAPGGGKLEGTILYSLNENKGAFSRVTSPNWQQNLRPFCGNGAVIGAWSTNINVSADGGSIIVFDNQGNQVALPLGANTVVYFGHGVNPDLTTQTVNKQDLVAFLQQNQGGGVNVALPGCSGNTQAEVDANLKNSLQNHSGNFRLVIRLK
jgi:hypothetical protein